MRRMRMNTGGVIATLSIAIALSPGCRSLSQEHCESGVCVELVILQPLLMDEPVQAVISVETVDAMRGLSVSIWASDPDISVEGDQPWVIETEVGTPVTVSTFIVFPDQGCFSVVAGVQYGPGSIVTDAVAVHMTTLGGTVGPDGGEGVPTPGPLEPVTLTPAEDS